MQNKTFPQNKTLVNQSPVKTNPSDKSPVQNLNDLADGKTPHQPSESVVS
jgi:hypothetical protein